MHRLQPLPTHRLQPQSTHRLHHCLHIDYSHCLRLDSSHRLRLDYSHRLHIRANKSSRYVSGDKVLLDTQSQKCYIDIIYIYCHMFNIVFQPLLSRGSQLLLIELARGMPGRGSELRQSESVKHLSWIQWVKIIPHSSRPLVAV